MNLLRKTVVYFVNSLLLFILSWSGSVWAASSISNEVYVSTGFATYGVLFSQDGTTLYSFGFSLREMFFRVLLEVTFCIAFWRYAIGVLFIVT